jgi:hypothetical protein
MRPRYRKMDAQRAAGGAPRDKCENHFHIRILAEKTDDSYRGDAASRIAAAQPPWPADRARLRPGRRLA